MDADVQNIRLILKGRLDTVAVMGVEVDDENPATAVRLLPVTGRYCHVVQKAEAQSHGPLGMVAWRTHRAEGCATQAGLDAIDGNGPGAGG